MSDNELQNYMKLVKKSHEAFRDFITHLSEDILEWQIHEFTNSVSWIIQHIIQDQKWIADVILNKHAKHVSSPKFNEKLTKDQLVEKFDKLASYVENNFSKLNNEILSELKNYKEYSMSVEDWLFEYIFHLNQHSGEISLMSKAWKRKERSIQD
jgi:hypothetical protein